MTRKYLEGRILREDLADQVNWYLREKRAPPEVVDSFLSAYDGLVLKLAEWPQSGRDIPGPVAGLREANLPKPYEHYVLLYIGGDDAVRGLRLFGSAQEREAVIRKYQEDPEALRGLR